MNDVQYQEYLNNNNIIYIMDQNYFTLLKEEKNQSVSLENRRKLANYQGRIVDHFRWEKKINFLDLLVLS